jgi:hypothetical protein
MKNIVLNASATREFGIVALNFTFLISNTANITNRKNLFTIKPWPAIGI